MTEGAKLTKAQRAMLTRIEAFESAGLITRISITNPSATRLGRRGLLRWANGGASGRGRWVTTPAGRAALNPESKP